MPIRLCFAAETAALALLFVLRLCGWGGILFVVLHFRVGGNIYTRTSFVSLCLCCYCWRYFLTRRLG